GVDVIGLGQRACGFRRLLGSERRMQPLAGSLAVQDVRDLEAPELEAVDEWLHFPLHRCGHAEPPGISDYALWLALDAGPAIREQAFLREEAALVVHLARVPHPVAEIGVR